MSRIALFSLLSVAAFTAQDALASKSVDFSFRVHSYGARLYPCDAGLRNLSFPGDYMTGAYQTWVPQVFSPTYVVGHWGTPTDLLTYFGATSTSANIPALTATDGVPPNDGSITYKLGKKIVDTGTELPDDITGNGLQFFLTSDTYSSEYFVDFCYQGPKQMIYNSGHKTDLKLTSYITNPVLLRPSTLDDNYLWNSNLKVQPIVACDIVSSVSDTDPTTSSILQNLHFTAGTPTPPTTPHLSGFGLSGDASHAGSLIPILTTGTNIWSDKYPTSATSPLILQTDGMTKNCVIRFVFKEDCLSANPTRPDNCERRNWDGEHAKFTLHLDVEPVADTNPIGN